MRRSITLATLAVLLAGPASQFGTLATGATAAAPSAYLQAVLMDKPVALLKVATPRSAFVRAVIRDRPTALLQGLRDLSGHGAVGTAVGRPSFGRLPNGDPAYQFNGAGQYLRFANRSAFAITPRRVLTVELWMRPDALQFARTEGSGYVYVMGKGNPGSQEWLVRMYSRANAESRPNRISGYSFNPQGGLGAGSYFQDRVQPRRWIHVVLVVNAAKRSARYPSGYTRIYKNGVLRDTDSLKDYNIVPRSGSAPLRIGTGYLGSFFRGSVGNVAFYDKELVPAQIRAHYVAGLSR